MNTIFSKFVNSITLNYMDLIIVNLLIVSLVLIYKYFLNVCSSGADLGSACTMGVQNLTLRYCLGPVGE